MSNRKLQYTLELDAELGDLLSKLNKAKESMKGLLENDATSSGLNKGIENIEKAIDRLKQKASVPVSGESTFASLRKDAAAIDNQLDKLVSSVNDFHKLSNSQKIELLPPELASKIRDAEGALDNFANAFTEANQKSQQYLNAQERLGKKEAELAKQREANAQKAQNIANRQADATNAQKEIKAIEQKIAALRKYQETQKKYEAAGVPKNKAMSPDVSLPKDRAAAKNVLPEGTALTAENIEKALEELNTELAKNQQEFKEAENTIKSWEKSLKDSQAKTSTTEQDVEKLQQELADLNNEFEKNKTDKINNAFSQLQNKAKSLGVDLSNIPLDYTEEGFNQLNIELQKLVSEGISQADNALDNVEVNLNQVKTSSDLVTDSVDRQNDEWAEANTQFSNNTAIMSRISAFVGLEGGIQLARRAMQSCFQTIKDLDAAMTEMAVVTELDVGDYWNQLSEHTARASALGLAIQDVYEAETLYYQQGLKTNEVQVMATETLKMARIAGLSAEDATNKMTAALRGFNMELNETSTQRVSDVYSELAAITASDVDEISSAMTKTASIASSAGMEFETTAAFLSQIIETTRESAETAGTALKTVIARFQELKKDPSEIGEIDGEIVDANKIETALRSVGVALRDSTGQFRDLDDVFLELAGKWDSLDTNTQRYIATIAAGSRQQSRFIAMMSDYGRTQELVSAANNSAGASNEQFEKTLDSLESKLAQLKNAWDTFTMGIMDSELLKFGVEILTLFIEGINKITGLLEPLGLDGAAKIGLVIGALYLGEKAVRVFMKSLSGGNSIMASFGAIGRSSIASVQNGYTKLNATLAKSNMQSKKLQQSLRMSSGVKYTKNVKAYTMAVKEQSAAQDHYNIVLMRGTTNENALNNARTRSIAADAQLIAAEQALAASMGLTAAQTAEANAMAALGVSYDQAAILASAGYTAANISEAASVSGVGAAEAAETILKKENTEETNKATFASFMLSSAHTLQQVGLKGLIKSWWSQLTAKFADIKATWAQAAANWGLQASMWPVLVVGLLIVAAFLVLVAVIWLIVKAIQAFIKNSPEGQLKSAEEAADAAAEAANRAAEAYNNLADAFDSLGDKYDSLEELTKGTEEWKEKVEEINSEVMDLIEKYPELAGLVKNEGGVLTIDLDGEEAQNVLKKYENASLKASAAEYAAKINVNEKKAQVKAFDIAGETYASNGDMSFQMSPETTKALAKAIQSGEIRDTNGDGNTDEIAEWLKTNGSVIEQTYAETFASQLEDVGEDLKEFGDELNAMTEQERLYNQQMANLALEGIDLDKYSEAQQSQMSSAATAELSAQMNASMQEKFDTMSKEEAESAKEDVAKNLYGEDATVSGNTITYIDEEGEEQTKDLTDEEFKEQWAAMEATEAMTAALEAVPQKINRVSDALNKFSKGLGDAYRSLLTDTTKTTRAESAQLSSQVDSGDLKDVLTDTFYQMSVAEQDLYDGDVNKFITEMETKTNELADQFGAAEEVLSKYGIAVDDVNSKFYSTTATEYADTIEKLSTGLAADSEKIGDINNYINEIGNSLSAEDFNIFMRELNAIDLADLGAWEGLGDTLKDLGLSSVANSEAFKNLTTDAAEAAGAIRKIDLKAFTAQFKNLQNVVSDIRSGEQGRTFDKDQYEKLIAMDPSLKSKFSENNDETFTFLGSNIVDLIEAINKNTEMLRLDSIEATEDKIMASDVVEALKNEKFKDGSYMDFASADSWEGAEVRDYLASAIQSFVASGVDVNSLGIAGLTNETTIESLNKATDADVKGYLTELLKVANPNQKSQYEDDLFNLKRELSASAMQNFGIEQNVSAMGDTQASSFDSNEDYLINLQARAQTIMKQAIEAGVNEADLESYGDKLEVLMELDPNADDFLEKVNALNLNQAASSLEAMAKSAEELSEEAEKWKTEFGYLDQLTRQIERTQREKEKAEREYTKLLESETLTQEELLELTKQQAAALNKEANLAIQQWAESATSLESMTSKTGKNAQFAQYVTYDATSGAIEVDYTGAEAAFGDNSEIGGLFDEYVSELYELQSTADDAQDALEDIEDEMQELQDRGKDQYSDLWNQVKEAMVNNAQKQIDKMSEVNDSIQSAESALVSQLQTQIEEQRQERQNREAEENIADKQSQLAYLMADSSGAGQLNALSLQKEIETEQQNYEDSLVDQALADLQTANEEAAQQRQQQIDIAQAQLDMYANSQQAWADAQAVLNVALSNDGALGQNLNNLGVNMSMLLGPDGTVAGSLSNLLIGDQALNGIEQDAYDQQVKADSAAAAQYAVMNGLLRNNNTGNTTALSTLGGTIKTEFTNWKDKEAELRGKTNETIGDARDDIAEKLIETNTALGPEGVKGAIGGLLPATEEKQLFNQIDDGTDASAAWDEKMKEKTDEGKIFTDYDDKLQDLIDAETAEKEKEASEKDKEQKANYASLLADSQLLSDKAFEALQKSGYISDKHTYAEYKTAHTSKHAPKKAEPESPKVVTTTGKGTNNSGEKEKTEEEKNIDKVKWTNAWAGEPDAKGSGHSFNWQDIIDGDKEDQGWVSISGGKEYGVSIDKTNGTAFTAAAKKALPSSFGGDKNFRVFEYEGSYYIYADTNKGSGAFRISTQYQKSNANSLINALTRYETGGLADFTGPAWLDGTKSSPELVLNAQDTKNFLQLKDILSEVMNNVNTINNETASNGNNYFDIQINVEDLKDDYDVEQLANKIRSMLYEDASYRNVNTVSLTR